MDLTSIQTLVLSSTASLVAIAVGAITIRKHRAERADSALRSSAAQYVADAVVRATSWNSVVGLRGTLLSSLERSSLTWSTFVRYLHEEAKVRGFAVVEFGQSFALMRP